MLPVDHQRQRPAERGILDLEEVGRVDGRVGVAVGEMGGVGRNEADAEKNGTRRRVHRCSQVDLRDFGRARDQELVRRQDGDAVGRERRRAGDRRDRRRCRGQVGLEYRAGRVRLREEDDTLTGIREREMARPVQAARDHDVRVQYEVEAGDRARVGADIEETAVRAHQDTARIRDRRRHRLHAAAQRDALDVSARELRDVGETVRFVQSDLVDAVHPRGHHGRRRPVHVAQSEPQQRPRPLRHIGMNAVDAERNVRRSVVARAEHGLGVRVGVDGNDLARPGVGRVELVGADPVGTTGQICIAGCDRNRYGEGHVGLRID